MNNNQVNFDPMTGMPVNNNVIPNEQINPVPTVQPVQPTPVPVESQQATIQESNNAYINPQIQNVPTVEQTKEDFIENTQANNFVKKEEKKEGPNIAFIIILFVIILAAILFLFPYLMDILG